MLPKLPSNMLATGPALTRSISTSPALFGLILQLLAFLATALLATLLEWHLGLLQFAFVQGGLAALFARLAAMPVWWLAIEFTFAPAIIGALALHLTPIFYLLAFVLLVLVYWSVFTTRVPLFLSSDKAHAELASLLPVDRPFAMIDLGSGVGGVLSSLAHTRKNGMFFGMEAAPLPFLISMLRLLQVSNCEVRWGSFWEKNLCQYDVVYAYLSPEPMDELWQKVRREMKPGALFISNTFLVPGVAPLRSIPLNDLSGAVLHVWQI